MAQQQHNSPPFELEEDLVAAVARYNAATDADQRLEACVQALECHPMVRKGQEAQVMAGGYRFDVQPYGLFLNQFRKYLKTPEGAPWKKIAGGVSDDGLYTVSPSLRKLMPRGFHFIRVFADNGAGPEVKRLAFRGIPKFTGMAPGDEDEESNSTQANFLFNGRSMSDITAFFRTVKSNGENAKFRLIDVEGKIFLLTGSKNTCEIWPADEPSEKSYPLNHSYPSSIIADVVSRWYLALPDSDRSRFHEVALKYGTFMGEIERVNSEHIIPVHETRMFWYSLLDQDGAPVHPEECFKIFATHAMPHAPQSRHPINSLDAVVDSIRYDAHFEGSVLYLLDGDNRVAGLVKVKANHYVITRRLREAFKGTVVNPITSGEVLDVGLPSAKGSSGQKRGGKAKAEPKPLAEVLGDAIKRLRGKMSALGHVPGCAENWEQWFETGAAFFQWGSERIADASAKNALETCLAEIDERFASFFHRFLEETGRPLFDHRE